MSFRFIDIETYPRREHFEHFLTMQNPFVSLTVQLDISDWLRKVKESGRPFFLSFLYAVGKAANSVPELRQRIRNDNIIEYDICGSSYTVALPDGTYRYCDVRTDLPFEEFLKKAKAAQEKAASDPHLTESDDPESNFFISCLPWTGYSALEMPHPDNRFSVPSITWGKYSYEERVILRDGQLISQEVIKIPVTLMVNHALVDGLHISRFFSALEAALK